MTEYVIHLSVAGVLGWSVVLVAVTFVVALRGGAVVDRVRERRSAGLHYASHRTRRIGGDR